MNNKKYIVFVNQKMVLSSYGDDLDSLVSLIADKYPNSEDSIQIYEADRYDVFIKLMRVRVEGIWQDETSF